MKATNFIHKKTVLIFIILSIIYFYTSLSEKFYQHSFDWSSEYSIKELGNVNIYRLDFGSIELQRDKILTKDSFNYNSIYKLNTIEGSLYFKSANITQTDSSILLARLNWLNHPPKVYKIKEALLKEVYIPFKDKGDIFVQMIGNQEIWMNEGRRLRYLMNEQNEQLSFVGSNSDAYGFKHEGYFSESLSELNDKIEILPANIYIIKVLSSYTDNDEKTLASLHNIIFKISSKNKNSSIIIISPFPSTNPKYAEKHEDLRKYLMAQSFSSHIFILDCFDVFDGSPTNEIFLNNGIDLTKKGYSILAKSLSNAISKIYKRK